MFKTVDRDDTHAIKWERYRDKNLLPLWVADMDIASPAAITEALAKRIQHPVYGYTHPWTSLQESVVQWCQQEYRWSIEPSWIVWMPGVVPSFNLAVDVFGQQGRVIVQSPNYPPMLAAAARQGCTTVQIPVTWNDTQWHWDWAALESELAHPECQLFLLCNPMNPNGSTLSKSDLQRLSSLCNDHDVFICSDEIHCDLILDNSPHFPAGSISGLEENSVTLMAASKTFNVAGLGCSFAIIPDTQVRKRWQDRMTDLIPYPNFLGLIAAETAFSQCSDWHKQLLEHLRSNRDYLAEKLNQFDGILYRPQAATFLAWIESTRPGHPLDKRFIEAGIMPSEGKFFGQPDQVRLNFGTGRDTLETAIRLLESG